MKQYLELTQEDWVENITRICEVSKLLIEVRLITTESFILPFTSERQMVRDLL